MNLSRREKIIGLVTGIVLGALVLDQLVVSPLLERLDNAVTMIQQHQEDLQKAESTFTSDLAARKRWKQMVGNGFKTDASAAEGQLLDRVRDAAQRSGISVQSFKPERSEKVSGFYRITIRVTATGNTSQAARFLYLLQTSTIPLKVMDLQISSRKDGTDDLAIQMGVATIFDVPVQKLAMGNGQREVMP